jgi:hypothetical protein
LRRTKALIFIDDRKDSRSGGIDRGDPDGEPPGDEPMGCESSEAALRPTMLRW